jgi:hypothetical protein
MPNTTKLQELEQGVVNQLDPEFLAGKGAAEVEQYVQPFAGAHEVDLGPAKELIEEAMSGFEKKKRAESDQWLGPRLHAALRLSRREASRKGVWRYLGICAFPEYVRWRFDGDRSSPDAPAKVERFSGPDYKHALARLWWMAEMFRDGPDYQPAVKALSNQDVINNLFRLDIAHHRPTALGSIVVLGGDGEGPGYGGREANALSKATNAMAATVLLDSFAPDEPLDDAARDRWIGEAGAFEAGLFMDELPEGPDDPPTPPESLERMKAMLKVLLAEAPVRGKEAEEAEEKVEVA